MTDEERDHYNNLIYLCGDDHTRIDKQERDFPVDKLLRMKAEHEKKVRDGMNAAFAEIGFLELQYASEWIVKVSPSQPATDYSVTPPDDKIRKNDLSTKSRVTITMGLAMTREVKAFMEAEAQLDADFPQRLTAGFLAEYFRLRQGGFKGDDLFDLMCQFAQQGMKDQSRRSAGIAILIYLFEACEVFEK